jgi:hypothetical protein
MPELAGTSDKAQPSLRCLYCGEGGPFNDEHVFPAGLGGDDAYLLTDVVCFECNTTRFSQLEERFMRSSPIAFPRVFLQEHGRGKGKRASTPTIHANSKILLDPTSNLGLDVEVRTGGLPIILFQMLFSDAGIKLAGNDQVGFQDFYDALDNVLVDTLQVVEKIGKGKAARFKVTPFSWNGGTYIQHEETLVTKLPANAIWRTSFPEDGHAYCPRLFQRLEGELLLRVHDADNIGSLLGLARKCLPGARGTAAIDTPVTDPSLHIDLAMDFASYPRVVAKIGMNLAAHVFGDAMIRDTAFDEMKQAILTGQLGPQLAPQVESNRYQPIFASVPHRFHVMALAAHPIGNGRCVLVFVLKLYGGPIHTIALSRNAPLPETELPVFFTVEYNDRRMERFSARAFSDAFPPVF